MSQAYTPNITEYSAEERYFLLLLYAPTNGYEFAVAVKGNLWLQKGMFLLSKELEELQNLKFDEDIFGPYSSGLQALQSQFANSHYIEQHYEQGPIRLTEQGIHLAKKFWLTTSDATTKLIISIKKFLNELKTWEVISFIYSLYPETTTNSEILDKFRKHRVRSAIEMYKRKKITIQEAIVVSGLSQEDFVNVLNKGKRTYGVKNLETQSHSDLVKKLRNKDYTYFVTRVKNMSPDLNLRSNIQEFNKFIEAFNEAKLEIKDYLLKAELNDIQLEMLNVKNLMDIILMENNTTLSKELKQKIDLLKEKLKTTAETEIYLKNIGVDEDQIVRSTKKTINQDGSVDLVWRNRGSKKHC